MLLLIDNSTGLLIGFCDRDLVASVDSWCKAAVQAVSLLYCNGKL